MVLSVLPVSKALFICSRSKEEERRWMEIQTTTTMAALPKYFHTFFLNVFILLKLQLQLEDAQSFDYRS